jgi:hypothetical protein
MASFQDRVVGAMRLNVATFEEVEHDASATAQAAMVVGAAALSAGLASGVGHAAFGVLVGLMGWAIGAFVLLVVGTKLLPGKNTQADYGQMLRTMGFAQAIGLFGILAIIPLLGYLIWFVIQVWILIAMVIAVRQALDYDDTIRAVIVCVVAWAIMIVVSMIFAIFGFGAAMLGSAF